MNHIIRCVIFALTAGVPAFATVTVTSPANGSKVTSPVQFVAKATSTCAKGVKSMGIYVKNVKVYGVNGDKLDTKISLAAGAQKTVVEELDKCGGETHKEVDVTVASKPTVKISAKPTSIVFGKLSTLTVTATHAEKVTVTGSDGSSYTLDETGGKQSVTPREKTTYTASAVGSGITVTAKTEVTVKDIPKPVVSISASPKSVIAGTASILTVAAANATKVVIKGTDGSSDTLSTTGGTDSVSPLVTTKYTVTVTGPGGTESASTSLTVTPNPAPTVTIGANPASVTPGSSSTLTVAATSATQLVINGSDNTSYTLAELTGGTVLVTPSATTTYTVTATGGVGTVPATARTTVALPGEGSVDQINHVILLLQENHSFDNYFGMLNPYRVTNGMNVGDDGNTYTVDGIDDKLSLISNQDDEGAVFNPFRFKTTCIDDLAHGWTQSFEDVNQDDFSTGHSTEMDGFVHTSEVYAKSCAAGASCAGDYTDMSGKRAMGYYDEQYLNYYYYMASQFAVSDRWFSPVASKTVNNRLATFSGGTTQGLVRSPGGDDKLPQLNMPNIFQELDQANVSWKIYFTETQGYCLSEDECASGATARWPSGVFDTFTYSTLYLNKGSSGKCTPPALPSSAVGDTSNSFCIDPDHIAPLAVYFTDLANGTLPSFAFIEPGYSINDEHPESGQSILKGQAEVAKIVNALMANPQWSDSVFFLTYDEGGGLYDHVPPVPGFSNQNTDASLGAIPDISTIAVNPDSYLPCLPAEGKATTHCDLKSGDPGTNPGDAATTQGFSAQLGFRVPNAIISPFTRRHYVSHTPMDHTAVIKFVESRFIGSDAHLTARDAVQPDMLEFFDFVNIPWASPPTPPTPVSNGSLGFNPCTPSSM
jgi:phospholipase C